MFVCIFSVWFPVLLLLLLLCGWMFKTKTGKHFLFFLYKLDNKTDFFPLFSCFSQSSLHNSFSNFIFTNASFFNIIFSLITLCLFILCFRTMCWLVGLVDLSRPRLLGMDWFVVCLFVCLFVDSLLNQLKIHLSWFPWWRRRWSRFFGNVLIYWWRIVQVSHSPR